MNLELPTDGYKAVDNGQIAYEAYVAAGNLDAGRSSITGERLPSWDEQRQGIRDRWAAAAEAVLRAQSGEG